MSEVELSTADLGLLLGLVDGTLDTADAARAEARFGATADGRRTVEAHRRVARVLRSSGPALPASLVLPVAPARHRPKPQTLRRLSPLAGVAVLVIALAVALAGPLSGGPTAVEAAEIGLRPMVSPAPAPLAGHPGVLAADLDGVQFPDWSADHGWHAHGARADRLDGRRTRTVFYEHEGHHIAYTIVSGSPLEPPSDAREHVVDGVRLTHYMDGGRDVVIFERGGRTCVLSGHVLQTATLFELASWRGDGAVSF